MTELGLELDLDTINSLLGGDKSTSHSPKTRPMQVGPLRYTEETGRCASRNCSSPTHILVEGVRRCTSHALYELNRLLIAHHGGFDYAVKLCECNAGKHSVGNVHTSDCPTFRQLKGDAGDRGSTTGGNTTGHTTIGEL